MTQVTLPNLSRTKEDANLFGDVVENDEALKKVVNGELDNENLKSGAGITGAKLADGAVTSRQLKPTAGVVAATENLTLEAAYANVPGAKLEITPAVASILKVTAIFDFEISSPVRGVGSLKLDAAAEQTRTILFELNTSSGRSTATQVYSLTLTPELHTIQMRAKKEGGGAGKAIAPNTGFLYELTAS